MGVVVSFVVVRWSGSSKKKLPSSVGIAFITCSSSFDEDSECDDGRSNKA